MKTSGTSIKPQMVYDGDCRFCRLWIRRWQRTTGDNIDFVPYRDAADRHPEIALKSFRRAVHLFEPDGRTFIGAHAVLRALSVGAGRHWPLRAYERVPGVAPLTEACYWIIARSRRVLSLLT